MTKFREGMDAESLAAEYEDILEQYASGLYLYQAIGEVRGVEYPTFVEQEKHTDRDTAERIFRYYAARTAERMLKYQAAAKSHVEALANECLAIADNATPRDVRVADLRIKTRMWLAEKRDPDQWGRKAELKMTEPSPPLVVGGDLLDELTRNDP